METMSDKFSNALIECLTSPDLAVKIRTLRNVPLKLGASEPIPYSMIDTDMFIPLIEIEELGKNGKQN